MSWLTESPQETSRSKLLHINIVSAQPDHLFGGPVFSFIVILELIQGKRVDTT